MPLVRRAVAENSASQTPQRWRGDVGTWGLVQKEPQSRGLRVTAWEPEKNASPRGSGDSPLPSPSISSGPLGMTHPAAVHEEARSVSLS